MSWFKKVTDLDSTMKDMKASSAFKPFEFWLAPEASSVVIVIDDPAIVINRHMIKRPVLTKTGYKDMVENHTCRSGLDERGCPMCYASNTARSNLIGTIMVYNEDAKLYRNLLALNYQGVALYKAVKDSTPNKTFAAAMFKVTRTDDKALRTGNIWTFQKYVDLKDKQFWPLSQDKQVPPEVIDYENVLRPTDYGMMQTLIAGSGYYAGSSNNAPNSKTSYQTSTAEKAFGFDPKSHNPDIDDIPF